MQFPVRVPCVDALSRFRPYAVTCRWHPSQIPYVVVPGIAYDPAANPAVLVNAMFVHPGARSGLPLLLLPTFALSSPDGLLIAIRIICRRFAASVPSPCGSWQSTH